MSLPLRTPRPAPVPPWLRCALLLAAVLGLLLAAPATSVSAAAQAVPPRPPAAAESAEPAPEVAAPESGSRAAARRSGPPGPGPVHRAVRRAVTTAGSSPYGTPPPLSAPRDRCPVLRC